MTSKCRETVPKVHGWRWGVVACNDSRRTFVPGRWGTEFTASLPDSHIRFEHGEYGDMRGDETEGRTRQALSVVDLYHSSIAVWCDYNTAQFSSRHSEFPPGALMSPGIYRPTLCEPLMRWKCEDAKRDGVQGAEGFQPSHRFHIKLYNTSLWIA